VLSAVVVMQWPARRTEPRCEALATA